jgi:hypothetical protein
LRAAILESAHRHNREGEWIVLVVTVEQDLLDARLNPQSLDAALEELVREGLIRPANGGTAFALLRRESAV